MVNEDTDTHTQQLELCVLAVAVALWVIWSDLAEVVPTKLRACRDQTGTNDLHTRITHQPYASVCDYGVCVFQRYQILSV